MALVIPKFTIYFQQQSGQGWSETWYAASAADINALGATMLRYIAGRILFLAKDCWITYARYGDASIKRYVLIAQLDPSATIGQGEDSTNQANDAVNVRCASSVTGPTIHRRSWLVGGVPDNVINGSLYYNTGGINTASGFYALLKAFVNGFVASNLAIKYVNSVGPPPVYAVTPAVNFDIRVAATRRRGLPFGLLRGRKLTT